MDALLYWEGGEQQTSKKENAEKKEILICPLFVCI
jgi:hypothetical protein